MIGVVVATHGRLAEELINAMITVGGPQKNIASGSIGPDDDMEKRRSDILTSVGHVEDSEDVVVPYRYVRRHAPQILPYP